MTLTSTLRDAAFRWIADDPDDGTRAELQNVLAKAMGGDASAAEELADRMAGPLEFGAGGGVRIGGDPAGSGVTQGGIRCHRDSLRAMVG